MFSENKNQAEQKDFMCLVDHRTAASLLATETPTESMDVYCNAEEHFI